MSLIHLKSKTLTLDLYPKLGGSIAGFKWHRPGKNTIDLMRPMSERAIHEKDIEGASSFPLTPFSNRVRQGKFIFQDRQITMPLNTPGPHTEHGHGWQRPWQAIDISTQNTTLHYTHKADENWPFNYEMKQHFQLTDEKLAVDLITLNTSDKIMPYGFGIHPYFPKTPECTLKAKTGGFWQSDNEVMPTNYVDVPPELNLDKGMRASDHTLDNVLGAWNTGAAINWPEHATMLQIDVSGPLNFLVIYTPPGEDYFCVEPVSNCTDAFNLAQKGRTDTGMIELKPGAQLSARISFTPKELSTR